MSTTAPRLPWRTALLALAIACAMFGFGYALIPIYYRICAVLGVDTARSDTYAATLALPAPRPLRVEFDANSHNKLIAMRPVLRISELITGQAYTITYEIENLTDKPLTGTAVPSYAPARSGRWLTKLQCFCFEKLHLAPREVYRAPVVLRFERDMPADINTLALSYTFHPDGSS